MREIGSEFWDIPISKKNRMFPKNIQWFLSGRSALKAIINELGECHTAAMPSWCCDSMIKPFADAGFEVNFFPVYWHKGIIQEIDLKCDVLFLMDYFGYIGSRPDLSGFTGVVIRDVTHSLFSATYSDADYYFGSLRKWCGVWTGGYAWCGDKHRLYVDGKCDYAYVSLRKTAMELKGKYMQGKGAADKGYLSLFEKAEEMLDDSRVLTAAERDVFLAERLDAEQMKKRRRENAEILRAAFSEWLIFPEMKDNDCPMFVPVFVPNGKRNELRRYLTEHEIYCPIHWPVSAYHKLNQTEESIYLNELSLVCDQRYSTEEMNRMVDTIKTFWKEA